MDKIDVERVLTLKAPKVRRLVPRFAIEWLRRLVHEREMNHIIENFGQLPPLEFIRAGFDYLGITYTVEGFDRLDPSERYIFASNHPFGGMDGLMLAEIIGSRMGEVRVVINDLLMYIEPLRPLWLPVNKHGRQNPEYVSRMREAFRSDVPVLTFPAGLCSRRSGGVVADNPWRCNFVKQAAATRRRIVPVYVEGALSDRFYRISEWRKRLGVGFNIEMILLPDEMFRQRGRDFRIRFGEPVDWQSLPALGSREKQAEYIREKAYSMKK